MKKTVFILGIILCLTMQSKISKSQTDQGAFNHMEQISKQYSNVDEQTLSYVSAAAHSNRSKKIDRERQELLQSIKTAIQNLKKIPDYKGDASLRDSTIKYLEVNYHVLMNDYAKVVDMEKIVEKSYDVMEAYIKAKEEANRKMTEASERLRATQYTYADKYGIRITENNSDTGKKLKIAGDVIKYYNKIYLIFFKSYIQEIYINNAIEKNDIVALEQNRNTLKKYADEGLNNLKNISAYKGDAQMISACRSALLFYKNEAENDVQKYIDYILKNEKYEKTKKAYDNKKQSERTQADVDEYNKAVKEYNSSANAVNATTNKINAGRKQAIDNWELKRKDFMSKHIPKK